MAIISIPRFMREFPVPVTAFNQTDADDIITNAIETTLMTGMAAWIKASSWPNNASTGCGNIFRSKQSIPEMVMLNLTIRLINAGTW